MTLAPALAIGNQHETLVLNGWKDIATYMGKGVRTVQRYERDLQLPVRRPFGKLTSSVVAKKSEIDAWINQRPIRETTKLSFRTVDNSEGLRKLGLLLEEMRRLGETTTQLVTELRAAREGLTITKGLLHENLQEQSSCSSFVPLFTGSAGAENPR